MRVVGGRVKGHRLAGTVSPGGRPTTERVRAAVFNILAPDEYRDGRVADLYAGSGSLGIEALSRGAAWADFVELDRRQCSVIRSNLERTGLSRQARVYCADVERALGTLVGPYRLVLLDPPYRMTNLGEALGKLASAPGLLDDKSVVVAGHSKRLELLPRYGRLRMTSHRRYGDNVVDFYDCFADEEVVDGNSPVSG